MKSEQIKEMTQKATEQLIASLDAGHSEALIAYLKAIGRFHRYSLHNVLLIALQKPNASYIAGFRTWNKLGRFVRKGEKGILILAPIVRQKDETEEEHSKGPTTSVAGFRAAYVFDIGQTDGAELPSIGVVQGDPSEHRERLYAFAQAREISIEYSTEIAPARGTSSGGRIRLLPGQSPAEEFSTLVHEIAHELLHQRDRRGTTSKRIRETEAEATAFVVSRSIGLDTGSAACDYIQLYNGDANLLLESLEHIQRTAIQILDAIGSNESSSPPA
jgi:antirestriction protein ArdC